MYLRKTTCKLESVLLAHQHLGKDTDSTSTDIYIYFHAADWLRYFILCKHWQEININKMIPDEQLQLIVMAISHVTACFSYWTIADIPGLKVSVTSPWRISQVRSKWQWKIVYYDDINYIKIMVLMINLLFISIIFMLLHLYLSAFIECQFSHSFGTTVSGSLASKTDIEDLSWNMHFLERKVNTDGNCITKVQ